MKNLYMVQASATYGGEVFKSAYLPYAAGLLVANAFTSETVKNNYEFKRFVFTRENTDSALQSFENPAVIGFSNYIWNTRYNLTLAKKVKDKYPDCIIIFGGHNVPPEGDFLEKYEYIDFLIHAEGEDAFLSLLEKLTEEKPDFSTVANLSYRENGEIKTNPTVVQTRTDYPSPYLTGVFDEIFRQYPDVQLDAILEISRGCPNHCAYCDWGCTASKVKLFPLERIIAEIEWFSAHKVAFLWGADANFGAYERDEIITDKLIEMREKTGYPERLRTNYAKTNYERVFAINRKLEKDGITKEGATLSFQSLNPDTLKKIGRSNMSLEKFRELMAMYREAGVTTYSELILGLPGETYESFCHGIGTLLENGQHRLINVYNCELLPNSPMADKAYMKEHGIRTADVIFLTAHSKHEKEIIERTDYVIETASMCLDEWVRANIFACFEKGFHHYGILRPFAVYAFYEKGIRYEDFYNRVIDYASKSDKEILNNAYNFLKNFYYTVAEEKPMRLYVNDVYGKISWAPDAVPNMDVIYRLDEYYEAVKPMFKEMGFDDDIVGELIRYCKCTLKRAGKNHFSEHFCYDWHGFMTDALDGNIKPLKKKENTVRVDNEKDYADWTQYGVAAAWFGRDGGHYNPGIERVFD